MACFNIFPSKERSEENLMSCLEPLKNCRTNSWLQKGAFRKNPSTWAIKSKIGVDKKSNTLWHFLESKAPRSSYKRQNNKINPQKDFHNLENLNHEIQNASQQASIWKSKTKSEISWEKMPINLLRKNFKKKEWLASDLWVKGGTHFVYSFTDYFSQTILCKMDLISPPIEWCSLSLEEGIELGEVQQIA